MHPEPLNGSKCHARNGGALFFVAVAALFGLGCHHTQQPAGVLLDKAAVGPVPLKELAAAIHGARELGKLPEVHGRYGQVPEPVVPFTVVVTQLGLPAGSSHAECTWDSDRLRSYKVVYVDARAEQEAMAERVEMLDAGVPLRDVEWDESMKVYTDAQRPLASARFDERLEPMEAPLGPDPRAERRYWAAFLCAHGNSAAILVDYVNGPVDGKGFLVVLANVDGTWQLIEARGIWIS